MNARTVAIATILCVLAPTIRPGVARAEDAPSAARLKDEADAMMDAKRFAEAVQLYARAYQASSDPVLLYNEGRALEALGEYAEAIERLERFRDVAPPALRARTKGLDEHIVELRSRVATLIVATSVRGARLLVRGKDMGAIDEQREVRVRAGLASIEVTADGYEPFRTEVDLRPTSSETVEATLVPIAAATLAVRTEPAGLVVEIDGQPRGRSPLELRIAPGEHVVRVTSAGGEKRLDLSLRAGERRDLLVDVDADANQSGGAPLTGKWWFWAAIGVLAAGAATTAIILVTSGGEDEKSGDFSPGRIGAPLRISF